MSDKINIQEIFKKYAIHNLAKRYEHVANMGDVDERLQKAIKEALEAVIDKCAEEVSPYIGEDPNIIDKQSILQVKQMIDYE